MSAIAEKDDPRYKALLAEVEALKQELADVRIVERAVILRINGLIDILKWLRKWLRARADSALGRGTPEQKADDSDSEPEPD